MCRVRRLDHAKQTHGASCDAALRSSCVRASRASARRPALTLHTTMDGLDRLVQVYVKGVGHCAFTSAQLLAALEAQVRAAPVALLARVFHWILCASASLR